MKLMPFSITENVFDKNLIKLIKKYYKLRTRKMKNEFTKSGKKVKLF